MRTHRTARGFSMIEALVALVVLSVGMLGIAGLYVESLRSSRTALTRTNVVNLVNDLADRIRSNRLAGNSYALAVGDTPDEAGCVVDNNCTAADLAQDDLARWVVAVRAALPKREDGSDPSTSVVYDAADTNGDPDQFTLNVSWREPGQDEDYSYQLTVRLVPLSAA